MNTHRSTVLKTIPLKQWKMQESAKLGISETLFKKRLSRKLIPYPEVIRKNRRVIEVIV